MSNRPAQIAQAEIELQAPAPLSQKNARRSLACRRITCKRRDYGSHLSQTAQAGSCACQRQPGRLGDIMKPIRMQLIRVRARDRRMAAIHEAGHIVMARKLGLPKQRRHQGHHSARQIDVMDLAACRTGHRLIYVVVLRNIFGRKALNAIPGFRAAVHEERHLKIYSRSASQNGLI
jgi:hypothetical protein